MAYFHIKKKKGKPYLYIRETKRINGKSKVVTDIYIGSPNSIRKLVEGNEEKQFKSQEFGAVWLCNQLNNEVNIAKIIDNQIEFSNKEKGLSIGEFFLFAIWNRMIEPKSKNSLSNWFEITALNHVFPVDIKQLTSQRYWEKWNRVTEEDLKKISKEFFSQVISLSNTSTESIIFDTTNYYTYMSSKTESSLGQRGRNKDSKHHLRQVGCALLVNEKNNLPLYYHAYPGNIHDSKLFEKIMDEMFGEVLGINKNQHSLTVVIDKGMNSESNYNWIDENQNIHFVTTYSTYFAQELTEIDLKYFLPVDLENDKEEEFLAYRTTGIFWGKERTVVVTYNSVSARKKNYKLTEKLELLHKELLIMKEKVNDDLPQWRNKEIVMNRYKKLCDKLHISSDFYKINLLKKSLKLKMSFKENILKINKEFSRFGKNLIITDNKDWPTNKIVKSSLNRWKVEKCFRDTKNAVSVYPIRHWTDGKIRCHLFTCVIALTYMRLLEIKLFENGVKISPESVMEQMSKLHSILELKPGRQKPIRYIEQPNENQTQILKVMGYKITNSGGLQKI